MNTETEYVMNGEARADLIKRLKAEGHEVRIPLANQLFIDIDTAEQYDHFLYGLDILARNGITDLVCDEKESRSGYPRRHITVTLPFDVDAYARIAFQAALGSGPVRELISCVRQQKGDIFPTMFVEYAKTASEMGLTQNVSVADFDPA